MDGCPLAYFPFLFLISLFSLHVHLYEVGWGGVTSCQNLDQLLVTGGYLVSSLPLLDSLFLFLMPLSCTCEGYPSVEQSYRFLFLVTNEEMYKYAVGGFVFYLFSSFIFFSHS